MHLIHLHLFKAMQFELHNASCRTKDKRFLHGHVYLCKCQTGCQTKHCRLVRMTFRYVYWMLFRAGSFFSDALVWNKSALGRLKSAVAGSSALMLHSFPFCNVQALSEHHRKIESIKKSLLSFEIESQTFSLSFRISGRAAHISQCSWTQTHCCTQT